MITDPASTPDAVRRRIGVVFQAFNLFPHMTVLQNVTLAPIGSGKRSTAEAEEHARELLARFGLPGAGRPYPDRLSGGQQQRVAIARALADTSRGLLLLDEVTSALDPELVGEVLEADRRSQGREGMTMLIATHEMEFRAQVADEVCFLHEGLIHERGTPAAVLDRPATPEAQRFLRRLHSIPGT